MRLAIALVLSLAGAPVSAQLILERDQQKSAPKKETKSPPAKQRSGSEPRPQAESKKSAASKSSLEVVAPVQPTTPPSKAVQQQQQMDLYRREHNPAQSTKDGKSALRCSAQPVCDRSSGSYGGCQGVEQSYSGAAVNSARQDVVRRCVQANTPDACNCAPQCSRVVRCSNL